MKKCPACERTLQRYEGLSGSDAGHIFLFSRNPASIAVGEEVEQAFLDVLACQPCEVALLVLCNPEGSLGKLESFLPRAVQQCQHCGGPAAVARNIEVEGALPIYAEISPHYGAHLWGRLCTSTDCALLDLYLHPGDAKGRAEIAQAHPRSLQLCRSCKEGTYHKTRICVPHGGYLELRDDNRRLAWANVGVCDRCGDAELKLEFISEQ